jgi:hypothetical protein
MTVGTQTEIEAEPLEQLCLRVSQMEHTLRIIYSRVNTTQRIVNKNFEKIMEGFRAIQKCWYLSAEKQMEIGEAVDNFKELAGQL